VQTKLKSQTFEPLIGFLRFLIQKYWPKQHKNGVLPKVNLPKIGYFIITFETETYEKPSKA